MKNKNSLALLLYLALAAGPACADSDTPDDEHTVSFDKGTWHVQLNGASHHNKDGYQERNYGLGLEYEDVKRTHVWKFAAGFLRNSMDDTTAYVGNGWFKRATLGPVNIDGGLFVSLMTYPSTESDIILAPIPSFAIGTESVGINLMYMPGLRDSIPAAFFVNLRIKL